MKSSLYDLNNHLFAQLERLGNEQLKGEEFQQEMDRSKAITSIAKEVISNARLALDAQIAINDKTIQTVPSMLESTKPPALEQPGKAQ